MIQSIVVAENAMLRTMFEKNLYVMKAHNGPITQMRWNEESQ